MYIDFEQFENPNEYTEEHISALHDLEDKLFLLQELEMYYHEAALTINQYEKIGTINEMNINNQAALNTIKEKIAEVKEDMNYIKYLNEGANYE